MNQKPSHNLEMLATVARGLKGLKQTVVFVGGATIELHLTQEAAAEARGTDDVDCVVELTQRTDFHALEEQLRKLGFRHPMGERAPMCRWDYHGIPVDVMPTEGAVLGFSNRWYPDAIKHAESRTLPDGQEVLIFSAPYLLASKIEAFLDRGHGDFLGSRDMEDIIAILDGCAGLIDEVRNAPDDLRSYLKQKFKTFLESDRFKDSLLGHIRSAEGGTARAKPVLELAKAISGL